MKYIVMECHKGYAVLMDEEARYVQAANLRYSVGQTVTSPVLMENAIEGERRISFYVTRFAAAAACLALAVSAGSFYYTRNFRTHSTVLISAKTNIRMDLNKKGQVIHLSGGDAKAEELLKDYDGKGKDKLTAANEILDIEQSQGLDPKNDVVNIYIKTDADEYNIFKEEFENGIADAKVNVYEYGTPKPVEHDKPEPPKPHEADKPKDEKAPEAPKKQEDKVNAPEPPKTPQDEVKAPEAPKPNNGAAAPTAPAQPAAPQKPEAHDTPEAPAPEPAKPDADAKADSKTAPKPDDKAEPPKPAEADTPAAPAAPASNNHFVLRDNNGIIEITHDAVEKLKPLLPAPAPRVQTAETYKEECREALPVTEQPSQSMTDKKEAPQEKPELPSPIADEKMEATQETPGSPETLSAVKPAEIKDESVRELSPAYEFSVKRIMPEEKDTPREALPEKEVSAPTLQPSVSPIPIP